MEAMIRLAARGDDWRRSLVNDPARLLWWVLRIAAAMCYVGHGAFGVMRKEVWLPFFALVGIGPELAFNLMPLVGTVDIVLGISVLVAPRRFVLLYMAVWAIWTAALRPLTGDSFFEMLERAGNYGIPIAMLILAGPARSLREWIAPLPTPSLEPLRTARAGVVLAWTTALLLVGHGALAAVERKALLAEHAASIGFGAQAAVYGGWMEIALALLVLAHPRIRLLLVIAAWKIATEALFPLSGAPVWEFVERGGSYAAPLALAIIVAWKQHRSAAGSASASARASSIGLARLAAGGALLLLAAAPIDLIAQSRTRALERAGAYCSKPAISSGSGAAPSGAARSPASATAPVRAAAPAPADAPAAADDAALLQQLRGGGYILACRHTITDHSASDVGSAREQQRNLSPEGERQARELGETIRALGIPIGDVRSSPMFRTRETSELAFGRTEIDRRLRGPGAADSLRLMLSRPVPSGTNSVFMTHTGILGTVFAGNGLGRIEEGGCVIVQPLGASGFRALRRVEANEWAAFDSAGR